MLLLPNLGKMLERVSDLTAKEQKKPLFLALQLRKRKKKKQ
jgi:hypothetical protein